MSLYLVKVKLHIFVAKSLRYHGSGAQTYASQMWYAKRHRFPAGFFLIVYDFFLLFSIGHVVGERIYKSKNKCAEIYDCMCILLHKLF